MRWKVVFLLLSDGVMCSLTGVSWVLQRLVLRGYVDWDRTGWIIQNVGLRPLTTPPPKPSPRSLTTTCRSGRRCSSPA